MKLRYFALIAVLAVTAAVALSAQQGTVHEKLYVSLEHTDNVAVVDLATFKPIKTAGGLAPARTGIAAVAGPSLRGGRGRWRTVTLIDTIRDEVIKTFHVGFGTEPQNGAITPDGLLVSTFVRRLLAGVRYAEGRDHRVHPHARPRAQYRDGSGGAIRVSASDCPAKAIGSGHRWACRGPNQGK